MTDSRLSGELEGSTLGSNSNDGQKAGTFRHRRAHGSSGFLVESSLIPQRTRKTTRHETPRFETRPSDKRSAAQPDETVHKKRLKILWKRQPESSSVEATASASIPQFSQNEAAAGSSDVGKQQHACVATDEELGPNPTADHATFGLDQNSLQIVNLALNLSESRKRAASSRLSAGHSQSGRRIISSTQPPGLHADFQTGSKDSAIDHAQANYISSRTLPDAATGTLPSSPNPDSTRLMSLVPARIEENRLISGFSDGTLARAEKARRHFELFAEYLRLLRYLPPLRLSNAESHPQSPIKLDDKAEHGRVYNPLQSIRNRKIRLRERCPVDTEANGWNDVNKVRKWVDSIDVQYGSSDRDPTVCLKLTTFSQTFHTPDLAAGPNPSPPSSVRRAGRPSSSKPRKPRFDWFISPAELLADAAWVEEGSNKSRLVDKDGNLLFSDATEFLPADASVESAHEKGASSISQRLAVSDEPDSRRSSSHSRSFDISRVTTRGRQRHRFHSPHISLNRSISNELKELLSNKPAQGPISPSSTHLTDGSHGISRLKQLHASSEIGDNTLQSDEAARPVNEPLVDVKTGSLSSATSAEGRCNHRTTFDGMDGTILNTSVNFFPRIAMNLSPMSSRSPSPLRRPFPRAGMSFHERTKNKHRNRPSPSSFERLEKDGTATPGAMSPSTRTLPIGLEPSSLPDRIAFRYEDQPISIINGEEPFKHHKHLSAPESKFRGIFKGRIAEIVGSEVSKVGDRILKKEGGHSRVSSSASSVVSTEDDSDVGDSGGSNSKFGRKGQHRRFATWSETDTRLTRKDVEKATTSKSYIPRLPIFTSQLRPEKDAMYGRAGMGDSRRDNSHREAQIETRTALSGYRREVNRAVRDDFDIPPAVHRAPEREQEQNFSRPFSLNQPPVTGLAYAETSASQSSPTGRPILGAGVRSWSVSARSGMTLNESSLPDKREISRTKALLLSSGIKAREINRLAVTPSKPSPDLLLRRFKDRTGPLSKMISLNEFEFAAQNLLRSMETTKSVFQCSVERFSTELAPPLRSQLNSLEILINQSLSPRVRAAASDAENLSLQLNTTSTLAVKQLSDSLDIGLRNRSRRFRRLRRGGFLLLEWLLIGVLWWVWLLVMVFKAFRGVFRGAVFGIRWIFWL